MRLASALEKRRRSALLDSASLLPGAGRRGLLPRAVQVVKDGFVSAHLLDIGPGEVALIDSGNDAEAKAVVAVLKARGLGVESVKAVVLTHGDIDFSQEGKAGWPRD